MSGDNHSPGPFFLQLVDADNNSYQKQWAEQTSLLHHGGAI